MSTLVPKIDRYFRSEGSSNLFRLNTQKLIFEDDQLVFIVGPNGSGKSLFLRNLINEDIIGSVPHKLKITKNGEIEHPVLVHQNPEKNLAIELSAEENFILWAPEQDKLFPRFTISEQKWLKEFFSETLIKSWSLPISDMSGGQKQSLAVATRLFHRAKILLLDEFTASIDVKASAMLISTIQNIVKVNHMLAIIASHDIIQTAKYADRVLVFGAGKIVGDIVFSNTDTLERRKSIIFNALENAYESSIKL